MLGPPYAKVALRDPLPELTATASLTASCGFDDVFLTFNLDTFEITDGVTLSSVNVTVNMTREVLGGWAMSGVFQASVATNPGNKGRVEVPTSQGLL